MIIIVRHALTKTVTMGEAPKLDEENSIMAKSENGVTSYSTDGGQTWSDSLPEGVTKNADGIMSYKAK